MEEYAVVGKLSFEGKTWPFNGALSMAITAAKQRGLRGVVVATDSAQKAAVVEEIEVTAVENLAQAVGFFAGQVNLDPSPSRLDLLFEEHAAYEEDYSDVRGQEMAKLALMIAARGIKIC